MIYLDHAATSHPKAPGVVEAITNWYDKLGVSAQRGAGEESAMVARKVDAVRMSLAKICGVPNQRLVFTSGATESINLFLRGFLEPGDAVLTTAIEHSSVARPLRQLEQTLPIELNIIRCDREGFVNPAAIEAELAATDYKLLVFNHASNVTGAVQEAAAFCASARRHGTATLVDASQTAGIFDLRVGADAVAASAHKHLLGPAGLGFLAVSDAIELMPVKCGGTGSSDRLDQQPENWPERLEAGTPNTPAILGLGAALSWLERQDVPSLHRAGLTQIDALRNEFLRVPDQVKLLGPASTNWDRIPILSVVPNLLDPEEAGILLAEAGLQVRTGYHCAPWIHSCIGTEAGGTVRISPGPFSSEDEILLVPAALEL